MGNSAPASAATNIYLAGRFAPVDAESTTADDLEFVGRWPAGVSGVYLRNGPNPRFKPKGQYHWFDGDGMVHQVVVRAGDDGGEARASYRNRYVRTRRFCEEEAAGAATYVKIGDLLTASGFVSVLKDAEQRARLREPQTINTDEWARTRKGRGTANTALEFHAGRFLALVEADVPHQFSVPELRTIGAHDYDGELRHPFTAHPKVCPRSGEMMFFGYSLGDSDESFCNYAVASRDGKLTHRLSLTRRSIALPKMMHDFAMTSRHSIILDLPLVFDKRGIFIPGAEVFQFRRDLPARFGVLRRHETDETRVRWFEFAPCYMFHTANAYDDGDEVVVVGCRSNRSTLISLDSTRDVTGKSFDHPTLHEWRMNLKTGESSERALMPAIGTDGAQAVEFPTINPRRLGQRWRYSYLATFDYGLPDDPVLVSGLIKFDHDAGRVVARMHYSEHGDNVDAARPFANAKMGGEASFVPSAEAVARGDDADEDDGFVVTFVTDSKSALSELWLMSARTLELVSRIRTRHRVPAGFHGLWKSLDAVAAQVGIDDSSTSARAAEKQAK